MAFSTEGMVGPILYGEFLREHGAGECCVQLVFARYGCDETCTVALGSDWRWHGAGEAWPTDDTSRHPITGSRVIACPECSREWIERDGIAGYIAQRHALMRRPFAFSDFDEEIERSRLVGV